jgi:hypothetical protein
MTTNVTIHNTPGHWKVKVFRRHIATGKEDELATINPGELIGNGMLSLWDDCELVIKEVPIIPEQKG